MCNLALQGNQYTGIAAFLQLVHNSKRPDLERKCIDGVQTLSFALTLTLTHFIIHPLTHSITHSLTYLLTHNSADSPASGMQGHQCSTVNRNKLCSKTPLSLLLQLRAGMPIVIH